MDNSQTNDQANADVAAAAADSNAANKPAVKEKASIKARVLVDCEHGKPNDVVAVTAAEAKAGAGAGQLDSDKAAVAYAESLKG